MEKALQYVRYRDRLVISLSLIKGSTLKVERQRKFLCCRGQGSVGLYTLQLISEGLKMVKTNLPWDVVLNLAVNSGKFSQPHRPQSCPNSQVLNGLY